MVERMALMMIRCRRHSLECSGENFDMKSRLRRTVMIICATIFFVWFGVQVYKIRDTTANMKEYEERQSENSAKLRESMSE